METNTKVTEDNDLLTLFNPPPEEKVVIFFEDGLRLEGPSGDDVSLPAEKSIVSVQVFDRDGHPRAFFVEPEEFGF